ncbi:hypothetical protein OY671_012067, partial [Metschnikowia pulcherrima]
ISAQGRQSACRDPAARHGRRPSRFARSGNRRRPAAWYRRPQQVDQPCQRRAHRGVPSSVWHRRRRLHRVPTESRASQSEGQNTCVPGRSPSLVAEGLWQRRSPV